MRIKADDDLSYFHASAIASARLMKVTNHWQSSTFYEADGGYKLNFVLPLTFDQDSPTTTISPSIPLKPKLLCRRDGPQRRTIP